MLAALDGVGAVTDASTNTVAGMGAADGAPEVWVPQVPWEASPGPQPTKSNRFLKLKLGKFVEYSCKVFLT